MASSKSSPAPWTKSHVRSISSPSSPSSLDQRFPERTPRSDADSPLDVSESRSAESPSIDWRLSFPAFNIPSLSSPASTYGAGGVRDGHAGGSGPLPVRAKEDLIPSPGLSSPASDSDYKSSPYQPYSDASFRSSPLTNHRDSSEQTRYAEKTPRPIERSFVTSRKLSMSSFSIDRSMAEEPNVIRASNNKKSRLNLLNPMSLLARRRSSQPQKLEEIKLTPSRMPAIPDFDPSIRGNIVHDFSSPRIRAPRRDCAQDAFHYRVADTSNGSMQSPSPTMHSPVFREHFHDDDQSLQPSQTAYLHNQQLEAPKPHSLPAFAQRLPVRLPSQDAHARSKETKYDMPPPDDPPPIPPVQKSSKSAESSPSRTPPRHKPSTSSRFSFQIAGHGSATQEKILEDKHREHFARKPLAPSDEMHDVLEDEFDDFDMDAQDLFEEEIPEVGMGDEWSSDEVVPVRNIEVATSQTQRPGYGHDHAEVDARPTSKLSTFVDRHWKQIGDSSSTGHLYSTVASDEGENDPVSYRLNHTPQTDCTRSIAQVSETISRHVEPSSTGRENSKHLPSLAYGHVRADPQNIHSPPNLFLDGLKISTTQFSDDQHPTQILGIDFDDGELYFDDGEFDVGSANPQDSFDESVFDEEFDQIRDIPAENAKKYQAALMRSASKGKVAVSNSTNEEITLGANRWAGEELAKSGQPGGRSGTLVETAPSHNRDKTSGLTEGNLAAYHDALALAATDAAANGRFDRRVSFRRDSNEDQSLADEAEVERYSASLNNIYAQESYTINDNGFIYDDEEDADEDLLIAEANAEALENDDDGVYGQEFGFYARARGKEASDLINGGFFSARGANGIKRSHSGRGDFQEPSLTPITERSEWSARNSIASVQMISGIPGSVTAVSSPGLNQLLDSPLLDDEMTLNALKKLRRGAFGGSSSSISSVPERGLPNSSPLAHVSTHRFSDIDHDRGQRVLPAQNLVPSMSILESEEEEEDFPEDLTTVKHHAPGDEMPETTRRIPGEKPAMPHVMLEPPTGGRGHHRRSSSGAESVSYTQDSSGRWILERRRTGDSGEIEVIAREYLPGIHI